MNAGIFPPSSQCGTPPLSIGGAPARPVQTPGGIDGALDWKRPNWPAIQDSLYASLRASNWGYVSRATVSTISAVADNYVGTTLCRNGLVFACPYAATGGLVFDPVNDRTYIVGSFGGLTLGVGNFSHCVTLNDGRVFVMPRSSTTARIIDIENRTVATPAASFPGGNSYGSACLIDGGKRIYLASVGATTSLIYDIQRDATTIPAGTFASTGFSVVLTLPDGRVFCSPRGYTAAIYDPVSDKLKTSALSLGGNTYFGAVLLPGGDEILIPQDAATSSIIYDWQRDTARTVSGMMPCVAQLAPNGTVLLLPRGSASPYTARVYSPATGTVTTLPETFSSNTPSAGIHVIPDGRIVSMPRSDSGIYTYGVKGPSFDPNVPLSLFYNHR